MKSLLRWTAASLAAAFLVSASQNAFSQAVWNGATSGSWLDGTNWTGGPPNGTGSAILFTGNTNTNTINDLPADSIIGTRNWNSTIINAFNVAQINGNAAGTSAQNAAILFLNGNFTSGAPSDTNGNFTLSGNRIILGGNILSVARPHSGTPTNNRTLRDTINLDMILSGSRTITTDQNGTNNQTQTQHSLAINGIISENVTTTLTKAGGQALLLNNGNNTFTNIQFNAGQVIAQVLDTPGGTASSIGLSNEMRFQGGALTYGGTGNQTLSRNITFVGTTNQGATLNAAGVGGGNSTLTFNGAINTIAGNGTQRVLTIGGANTGANTFLTDITNQVIAANSVVVPMALTKADAGLWVLAGNNTYSGVTQMNAGTLRVGDVIANLGTNPTWNFNGGELSYSNGGNVTTTVSNRTINLMGAAAQNGTFRNDSAGTNNTMIFDGTVVVGNSTGNKTLILRGGNTGANIFNATIGNAGNASAVLDVNGNTVGNGFAGLQKSDGGTWVVSGNNTFTRGTNVNGGNLVVPVLNDDVAVAQPIGINGTTTFSGGNLIYQGETPISVTANRTFNMTASSGFGNNSPVGNSVILNATIVNVTGTAENNNTRVWTLSGNNTGNNQLASVIADGAALSNGNGTFRRPTSLQKTGTGLWEVTSSNTYSGQTLITQGTLVVSDIANQLGTGAEIGAAGTNIVGNAAIRLGNANLGGTLRHVGAGETYNKLIQIGGGTAANNNGGGTIQNNGTAALIFNGEGGFFNSNDINTNHTAAQRTLTLGGNTGGAIINQINGIIRDNVGNLTGNFAVGVAKANGGGNTWALSGANTYTGTTAVTGGVLLINGNSSAATGDVNVSGNTTVLGGTGIVGGNTTISSTGTGGRLSPGQSPGLLTFNQNLTMGVNSTLVWELNGNTNAGPGVNFDQVLVNGALTIDPTAGTILNGTGINVADTFWDSDQSWLVFDVLGDNYAGAVFGGPILGSLPAAVASKGTFSWGLSPIAGPGAAGNVYLNYAIPEPSSVLLTVLGLAGAGLRRSRKNRS